MARALDHSFEPVAPGACPCGIALRSRAPDDVVPFQTWAYMPPYPPPGVAIRTGSSSAEALPLGETAAAGAGGA